MVSPGKLRAVSELRSDDRDAFEPSIDETGDVTYPSVERHFDERDGEAVDFLEAMVDRGVLSSEFEHKVYVCPKCSAEGMQYSTGCSECGSVHATREPAVVHPACEGTIGADRRAGAETPEDEQGKEPEVTHCPNCDEEVPPDELERDSRYRCHDCDAWLDSPAHRLWCRECLRTLSPQNASERPLYRYSLTTAGERWITEQLDGRRSLAETFEARGYDTRVDTTVPTSSDDELSVHVYAEDELLDDRIVAGVHDAPGSDDVRRLVEAAGETDARPILLLTGESLDERAAEVVDAEDVTVVNASDGSLSREYGTTEKPREGSRLFAWLDSLFPSSTAKR